MAMINLNITIEQTAEEEKELFEVLNEVGITPSQAIEMFFVYVRKTKSIAFLDNISLVDMVGRGRGVFSSPEEVDRFIRTERDEWG